MVDSFLKEILFDVKNQGVHRVFKRINFLSGSSVVKFFLI